MNLTADLTGQALRFAVVDYLVKPFDFEELLRAVRRALETRRTARMLESLRTALADGGTVAQIARRAAGPGAANAGDSLTPREREILQLLADGMSNVDVAQKLFISQETVKSHVRHILAKLEADTRTHAVAIAIRESIID